MSTRSRRAEGVSEPFPAGLPLTREDFEAWFHVVYEIALRGAFGAKLAPFGGVEIAYRGGDGIVRAPYLTRREAKMDALSHAAELVYTAGAVKNPILGRCYKSVEHLAHTLRKVADGHAHRRRRAELKAARLAPSPVESGVRPKTENVVPDTAEASAPRLRFVPKYVTYEDVPCPACPRGTVSLTTRRCPECDVMIPHGATVQLADAARERMWTRTIAEASRNAANRKSEDAAEDSHPYESMLPHAISAPWTAGLQAGYRAGRRQRAERRLTAAAREVDALLNMADDAREAENAKPAQFDRGAYVPSYVLGIDAGDAAGAAGVAPARPVHRRRHPAAPITEPMTARQRLDRGLPVWRLAVACDGELVLAYEVALSAGRVPAEYRRRRPGAHPDWWPTPRPAARDVPAIVQRYRARTVLIGAHLVAGLDSVAEATGTDDSPPEMPGIEPPVENDFALAEALISSRPDFRVPYDAGRRARAFRLLQLAWYAAAMSSDYEMGAREYVRRCRLEDAGRLREDTGGKTWRTSDARFVQRWAVDQRGRFRNDLRDVRLHSQWEGW